MNLRLRGLALVLVLGCHTIEGGGAGAHGPGSATAQTAAPPSASTAAPTSPAPAPSAATGPAGPLELASGAVLKLPKSAIASPMNNAAERLPSVVKAAHKYQIGDDKRLLLINEMDREGLDCKGVLDRELERAEKARNETDEQKRAMRQMKGISEIKIGEHRALYAVSQNRAPTPGSAEADTSKPMLGVATLMMCRDGDYVVMMHAADQSAPPEDTKKLLVDIAASYEKK